MCFPHMSNQIHILFIASIQLFLDLFTIILSHPKATLLEAAVNGRDVGQLRKLLGELRQQAVYHLLFQSGGEWKQKKRIDRHGNYVG